MSLLAINEMLKECGDETTVFHFYYKIPRINCFFSLQYNKDVVMICQTIPRSKLLEVYSTKINTEPLNKQGIITNLYDIDIFIS